MNEQHRDDPHDDANQRDCLQRLAEQLIFYRQQTAEISHLAHQASLQPRETENVAQSVFLKFLEKGLLFTGKNEAQCHAWLVKVARREIANVRRQARRHPTLSLDALGLKPRDRRRDEPSAEDREADLKGCEEPCGN